MSWSRIGTLVAMLAALGAFAAANAQDEREGFDDAVITQRVSSALDADPVLGRPVGAHRVDRRDDGVCALDHGCCEVRVVEVTNPLLYARECRGSAGAPYDRTHRRAPIDQRCADTRAHEAVRSGDYDDGGLVGRRDVDAEPALGQCLGALGDDLRDLLGPGGVEEQVEPGRARPDRPAPAARRGPG